MPATGRRVALDISWLTIFKLMAAVAFVWIWLHIVNIVLLVVVAVLLAVTLAPLSGRLERRGIPRWLASTIITFTLFGVIVGFLWLTWSSLSSQANMLGEHLRDFEKMAVNWLPPAFRDAFGITGSDAVQSLAPYALGAVRAIGSAVVVVVLAFIVTLYLLIERDATYQWLIAFFPRQRRPKIDMTATECQRVIFAYVAGNVATSVFATVFVLVTLSILKVPGALLLALLAGLFDFVPVLGFICSLFPALLLALTVSSKTAIVVVLCYIGYHAAENYLIGPLVYGDRLKLSNVAVILAFAVGASIAGVVGALIALPFAAAYPAVERIWLREKLPADTVKEHREIERKSA